jgi:glycerol-3-phosphate acyltransferase PlsX
MIIGLVKRDAPAILERADVRKIFQILDYATYGGAPLLGVQGVCIICHGSSTSSAVKNAIRVAVQSVEAGLSQHIGAEFAQREAATSA